MPQEIDKTLKVRFSDTIKELPQQKVDRLMGRVTETTFGGGHQEFDFGEQSDGYAYDYNEEQKVQRIKYLAPSLIVRKEQRKKFIWSNGFSLDDRTRLNKDTVAHYSRIAIMSYNRWRTEFALEAAWRPVESKGVNRTFTSGELPATQRLALLNSANNAFRGLTKDDLIQAKVGFKIREVGQDEGGLSESNLTCALAPGNLEDLLKTDEIVNSDYSTIKALVRGEVDSYMGFKFIYTGVARSKRLTRPFVNTTTKELNIAAGSNPGGSAPSGQVKLGSGANTTAEFIVFFHTDGICRGPVEGSNDAEIGKDHELYGDQYMYVRKMDGRLRHIDAGVVVYGSKTTTGGAYRVAPVEDTEFKNPTSPVNN